MLSCKQCLDKDSVRLKTVRPQIVFSSLAFTQKQCSLEDSVFTNVSTLLQNVVSSSLSSPIDSVLPETAPGDNRQYTRRPAGENSRSTALPLSAVLQTSQKELLQTRD